MLHSCVIIIFIYAFAYARDTPSELSCRNNSAWLIEEFTSAAEFFRTCSNEWIQREVEYRMGSFNTTLKLESGDWARSNNINWKRKHSAHSIATTALNRTDLLWKYDRLFLLELFRLIPIAEGYKVTFPLQMIDCPAVNRLERISFAYSRPLPTSHVVLVPLLTHHGPNSIEFAMKDPYSFSSKRPVLFWRGRATGIFAENESRRKHCRSQGTRIRLVSRFFNTSRTDIDVAFIQTAMPGHNSSVQHRVQTLTRKPVSNPVQLRYKYILCVEGNDWASSFTWVLASNSVPFHVHPMHYETVVTGRGRVLPWVHYIPVAADGSDLETHLDWCKANEEACGAIAANGRNYMQPFSHQGLSDAVSREVLVTYMRRSGQWIE